jgi:tetratricopeptide (TPR) repeat protein
VAGLLCYRRGLEDPLRRWAWFGAAALAVAAGVWSKESAIISPMVAVVYDLCFPSEAPGRARLWGYGCLTLPCLLYFLARPDIAPLHIPFTDNPLVGADFWTARLTAFKVIGKYIALLLFPGRLSSDYSYHQIPVDVDWQVAAALAACIAIAGLAVYGWRKDRRWFFFIALGAIGLAPTANLAKLIGTIMAERFLYVPAMGFAGCLVLTILAVSRRFPKPEQVLAVAVTVFCLAFGWRTYARNLDWADQRSMSQGMVAAAPGSYKGHAFYFGSLDDSVRHVEVALRILQGLPDEQNSPVAYINAGKWFRDKGQTLASAAPSESAAWFQRSLEVLLHGQRILKAIHQSRFEIDEQLGLTYSKLGNYPNALEAFQTALRQNFTEDLTREVSATFLQMGNVYQAEVALWRGLLMAPDNRHFAAWLIDIYARSDPGSCALQSQSATRNVNLACAMVREQACAASAGVARMFREAGQQSASVQFRDAGIAQFGCAAGQYN